MAWIILTYKLKYESRLAGVYSNLKHIIVAGSG
jgi:hypothetical protein